MLIKDAARQAAEQTLATHWPSGRIPVDPYEIALGLNISVVERRLPEDISGMIVKLPDQDAEIFLEENDSSVRRVFTCAHEIGHWMEQVTKTRPSNDFAIVERRGGPRDAHEFYADEFAGNLLMPRDRVEYWLQNQGMVPLDRAGIDVVAFASAFDVSVAAGRVRLRRLNYAV